MAFLSRWLPLLLMGLCWSPSGAAEVPKEYQIKAVLLFNLARFVDWPESTFSTSNAPIVIGIVGRDPFARALDEVVSGEEVNGRRVVIERFPSPRAIGPCQILFIGNSERTRMESIHAALREKPVLTVSELSNFATSLGGMVRLYTNDQNKVRLQVNLEQVRARGLKLSSKLLQVAELTRN